MVYHRRIYLVVSSIFYRTCWSLSELAGLKERYLNEPQFGLQLRMIAALAFVPTQDLINSFDELCVSIRNQYDGDADEVLNYFEHTYIGCFCRKTPDALLYFLSSYGARLNDLLKCFHEQIIKSRLGIIVSKQMFHPLTQRSGSF